jgi:hypothetical protein
VKRFHNYASVAFPLQSAPTPASVASVDDARENFLIELASFHLSLKKAVMVCEAESRQVDEYEKEQQKIGELKCVFFGRFCVFISIDLVVLFCFFCSQRTSCSERAD